MNVHKQTLQQSSRTLCIFSNPGDAVQFDVLLLTKKKNPYHSFPQMCCYPSFFLLVQRNLKELGDLQQVEHSIKALFIFLCHISGNVVAPFGQLQDVSFSKSRVIDGLLPWLELHLQSFQTLTLFFLIMQVFQGCWGKKKFNCHFPKQYPLKR